MLNEIAGEVNQGIPQFLCYKSVPECIFFPLHKQTPWAPMRACVYACFASKSQSGWVLVYCQLIRSRRHNLGFVVSTSYLHTQTHDIHMAQNSVGLYKLIKYYRMCTATSIMLVLLYTHSCVCVFVRVYYTFAHHCLNLLV